MGGKKKEWTTARAVGGRAALRKDAGGAHAHPRTFSPYEEAMLQTHTSYGKVLSRGEGHTSPASRDQSSCTRKRGCVRSVPVSPLCAVYVGLPRYTRARALVVPWTDPPISPSGAPRDTGPCFRQLRR